MDGWLKAHAVFVTATSAALHLAGGDPGRLARMAEVLRLMVRATREGFASLRSLGSFDAPRNLRLLYGRMPEWFAVVYWQRTLPTPLGELGLAAHARVARQEMSTLAREVQRLVQSAPAGAPTLELLYRRAGMVESAG